MTALGQLPAPVNHLAPSTLPSSSFAADKNWTIQNPSPATSSNPRNLVPQAHRYYDPIFSLSQYWNPENPEMGISLINTNLSPQRHNSPFVNNSVNAENSHLLSKRKGKEIIINEIPEILTSDCYQVPTLCQDPNIETAIPFKLMAGAFADNLRATEREKLASLTCGDTKNKMKHKLGVKAQPNKRATGAIKKKEKALNITSSKGLHHLAPVIPWFP